ncbi:MAG: hypothetical protein FWF86_08125 [Clostridia bacterium]|nr:hypothetical protein [Clostridia bacterium]
MITTQHTKDYFYGNGLAREFSLSYPAPDAPVGKRYIHLIVSDEDGKNPEFVLSNFQINRHGKTASVVYPAVGDPLESGKKLTVFRLLPLTQPTDLENGGNFYAETVEDTFDWIVMQIQQLDEAIGRALKIPLSAGLTGDALMDVIHSAGAEARASADDAAASARNAADSADLANKARAGAERAAYRAKETLGHVSIHPAPSTIPLRGPQGQIKAGEPGAPEDVVTVKALGMYPADGITGNILDFAASADCMPGCVYQAGSGFTGGPPWWEGAGRFWIFKADTGYIDLFFSNAGAGVLWGNLWSPGAGPIAPGWAGWRRIDSGGAFPGPERIDLSVPASNEYAPPLPASGWVYFEAVSAAAGDNIAVYGHHCIQRKYASGANQRLMVLMPMRIGQAPYIQYSSSTTGRELRLIKSMGEVSL